MTYLFESSLSIVLVGTLVALLAFAAWLQTRRKAILVVGILVAALTIIAVIVERTVVTDSEEVKATIHEIARSMQTNEVDVIVRFISDQQPKLRQQAKSTLQRVSVQKVTIKPNLRVAIDDGGRTAQATFNAVARVNDKSGSWKNQLVPRFMIVDFAKQGDDWKVIAYEERDPREGMKSR